MTPGAPSTAGQSGRMPNVSEHVDGRLLVHPETRTELRAWLAANHERGAAVWLVQWKKATGRPRLGYADVVEELLCFGWIDSKAGMLDAEREMVLISPRKRGSAWARSNKERVERLEAAGLMTDAGRRPIKQAHADGSWSLLDEVEALAVPPDLADAFSAHPGSRERWDAFPPSARKMHLAWLVQAKTAPTRSKRLEEIASKAAIGVRANQPTPPPKDGAR